MTFDRAALLDAFADLGRRAWAEGASIEIAVYGGSALMLVFDWRAATKDVDGVFENDRAIVRRLAADVAAERGWPSDWLNDGVKGFLSTRDGEAGMKPAGLCAEAGISVRNEVPGYASRWGG